VAIVQVLGSGCRRCQELAAVAQAAVRKRDRGDHVEHLTQLERIHEFAPWALPALVIDGRLEYVGAIPSVDQLCDKLISLEEHPCRSVS
jgi:hypothetical protein